MRLAQSFGVSRVTLARELSLVQVRAIREATDDQSGYYLLGYSPGEGTFDKDPRSAAFHTVTVRVNRPELNVRWKSGFAGVPDEALRAETASGRLAVDAFLAGLENVLDCPRRPSEDWTETENGNKRGIA